MSRSRSVPPRGAGGGPASRRTRRPLRERSPRPPGPRARGLSVSRSPARSCLPCRAFFLLRLEQVGSLRLHVVDVADEIKGLLRVLRVVVELALGEALERVDRLLERDQLARHA